MKKIGEIDRNMAVVTRVDDPDVVWYDVHEAPFSLHGFSNTEVGDLFRRVPKDVADNTNPGVAQLATNTAGGRVRFATNSAYVAIHVEISEFSPSDLMADTGIYGFDLYIEENGSDHYVGAFRPGTEMNVGYESKLFLPGEGMRQVTIHFPLYNQVDKLFIGLKEGSTTVEHRPYRYPVPVVYYGSSITQGGCASRPGNAYPSMISRMLDCEQYNLGFSGSAKGEDIIVNYMAGLEMSVFVSDYDHNAPNAAHLRATHSKLYHAIRAAHPDLPIILISRPPSRFKDNAERREVIWETYQQALAEGDTKVKFIDGQTLFDGDMADDCTVDGSHPNDFGFYRMAKYIGAAVAEMLGCKEA